MRATKDAFLEKKKSVNQNWNFRQMYGLREGGGGRGAKDAWI